MSFEMKYDRDGNPIKGTPPEPIQEQVQPDLTPVLEALAQPEQEVVEVEDAQVEQEPNDVVEEVPVTPVAKSNPAQESWKALREQKDRAEKRAQELEQALQDAQSRKQPETEDDNSLDIEDDAIAEGKHLRQVKKEVKSLKAELYQHQQQALLNSTEAKLKAQYPDFDSIVSAENLANLRAAYPEISQTLNSSNDLYSKAVSAYTMIKRLGISAEPDVYSHEKAQAVKNAAKPRPVASISPQQGDSPLSKANAFANGTNDFNDGMKSQYWKEMNQARKGY